jgi:hypothetical protein
MQGSAVETQEDQERKLPRFIQLEVPLSPLKPTAQLQHGVNRIREALYLHLSLRLIKHRLKIIKVKGRL